VKQTNVFSHVGHQMRSQNSRGVREGTSNYGDENYSRHIQHYGLDNASIQAVNRMKSLMQNGVQY